MIYKRLFQEKAMSVSDAIKNNYSLLITKSGSWYYFILYDSKILNIKQQKEPLQELIDKSIIAMIVITKDVISKVPKKAFSIIRSKAKPESKAGVLMYDIAMSYVSKKGQGLVPDRLSVSPSAQKVWMKYFTDRNDVKKIKIDGTSDKNYPSTKDKSDDGDINKIKSNEIDMGYDSRNFLNYIYIMTKPLNYDKLLNNSEKFLINWNSKNKSNKIKNKQLIDASITFFD